MSQQSPRHTWASRLATMLSAPLALVELHWATRTPGLPLAAAAAALVVATVLCFGCLLRSNVFGARLCLSLLAGLQVAMGLLAISIGLPGEDVVRGDAMVLATIAVGAALLVALGVDSRLRSRSGPTDSRPRWAL